MNHVNIAKVEPFNHLPVQNGQMRTNQETTAYHPVYHQNHLKADSENYHEEINKMANYDNDALKEFSVSKSDPKYQTLPYNTKFTVSLISNRMNNRLAENNDNNNVVKDNTEHISTSNGTVNNNINIQSQQHMTVHSAPLNTINKNVATPLSQNDLINRKNFDQANREQHLQNGNMVNGHSNGSKSESNNIVNNTTPYQVNYKQIYPHLTNT